MPEHRARTYHRNRVAQSFSEEIGAMLEGELSDPRIFPSVVTDVVLAPGGKSARVLRGSVHGGLARKRKTRRLPRSTSAQRLHPFSQIRERMGVRHVPELSFAIDRSEKMTGRMDELLGRMRKREAKRNAELLPDPRRRSQPARIHSPICPSLLPLARCSFRSSTTQRLPGLASARASSAIEQESAHQGGALTPNQFARPDPLGARSHSTRRRPRRLANALRSGRHPRCPGLPHLIFRWLHRLGRQRDVRQPVAGRHAGGGWRLSAAAMGLIRCALAATSLAWSARMSRATRRSHAKCSSHPRHQVCNQMHVRHGSPQPAQGTISRTPTTASWPGTVTPILYGQAMARKTRALLLASHEQFLPGVRRLGLVRASALELRLRRS